MGHRGWWLGQLPISGRGEHECKVDERLPCPPPSAFRCPWRAVPAVACESGFCVTLPDKQTLPSAKSRSEHTTQPVIALPAVCTSTPSPQRPQPAPEIMLLTAIPAGLGCSARATRRRTLPASWIGEHGW